jgi:hypothetical protein
MFYGKTKIFVEKHYDIDEKSQGTVCVYNVHAGGGKNLGFHVELDQPSE